MESMEGGGTRGLVLIPGKGWEGAIGNSDVGCSEPAPLTIKVWMSVCDCVREKSNTPDLRATLNMKSYEML